MHRPLPRFGLLALSALLLSSVLGNAAEPKTARAPNEPKKLYILLAFDTDSNLTESLQVDQKRIANCLNKALKSEPPLLPADRYEIKVLTGKEVTAAKILAYFRDPKLKVGPDTSLVFVYGGHGATDEEQGHYLDLTNDGPLVRSELVKAMEARNPRLAVLLTDCCSTRSPKPVKSKKEFEDIRVATRGSKIFQSLFLESRGTVDITAATGNASWGDDANGGLFTRVLCRMLLSKLERSGNEGPSPWKPFFEKLQKSTEDEFKTWKAEVEKPRDKDTPGEKVDAENQKPQAYILPKAFAVVGLENKLTKAFKIEYRWPGQTEWKVTDVPVSGKVPLFVEVENPGAEGSKLELRFAGQDRVFPIKSKIWKGRGMPAFTDGALTQIGRGK